jgi:hypothetical protein
MNDFMRVKYFSQLEAIERIKLESEIAYVLNVMGLGGQKNR